MSVLQSGITKSLAEAYTIDQSLRFEESDSAKLSRVQGAGNRKTWTFSCWFKRGKLATSGAADRPGLMGVPEVGGAILGDGFRFVNDTDILQFLIAGGSYSVKTTQAFRDTAAWYHFVCVSDTTQAVASNRMKFYLNGVHVTDMAGSSYPTEDYESDGIGNSGYTMTVGQGLVSTDFMDGYMAEVYFIDGTAYDADDFGETDSTTNQWIPKEAVDDLTFGTNGFYQKYSDPHGTTAFTSAGAGTWTCPTGVTSADILIVAGGGAGGCNHGGGGGAGGVVYNSSYTVVPGVVYDITVGAGGAAGSCGTSPNGDDSVFNVNAEGSGSTMTAVGGGAGGSASYDTNREGGSGGGGAGHAPSEASDRWDGKDGTQADSGGGTGYGYNGGDGYWDVGAGAGGGGSGANGASTGSPAAQNGGIGGGGRLFSNFTAYGFSGWFAGGGGGGPPSGYSGGTAEDGGGAGGAYGGTGNAATANTGGGGGGGGGNAGAGGSGGSGIVLIRVDNGLGADSSGNGNTFTVTNLLATDQMKDSPTNNFATFNSLVRPASGAASSVLPLSEGNLKAVVPTNGTMNALGQTIVAASGKWYWELYQEAGSENQYFGIASDDMPYITGGTTDPQLGNNLVYKGNGQKRIDGTASSYGASYTAGDIIGVALNMTDSEITFYKNNSTQGAIAFSGSTAVANFVVPFNFVEAATIGLNMGSDSSFAGALTAQGNQDSNEIGDFYYEPPTDFLALCTSNLSAPSIKKPGDHFNTVLYTGDGTDDRAITGVGFQPDFLWQKNRGGTGNNRLYDSIRGVANRIVSNSSAATTQPGDELDSFDSDGFTIDVGMNEDTATFVAWNWLAAAANAANDDGDISSVVRANTTSGFSIVSYSGSGTGGDTVGHGLSVAPDLIITKNLDADYNWAVSPFPGKTSFGYALYLDTTHAETGESGTMSAVSASTFTLYSNNHLNNNSGTDYISYCFHSVEGYSKAGIYTGNGSSDGTFVYLGFRPAYVLVRGYNVVTNWNVANSKSPAYNVINLYLTPNATFAESEEAYIDFLSNGFKCRNSTTSLSAAYNYLFYAVAESPFKYSNAR